MVADLLPRRRANTYLCASCAKNQTKIFLAIVITIYRHVYYTFVRLVKIILKLS